MSNLPLYPDKLVLVTNDDGIAAPGFRELVKMASRYATVIGVAPSRPQSGMSSAITVGEALRVNQAEDIDGARIFSVNGTPVDCVKLALHTILPRVPDFVLSGINHGSNAGNSIIYSGTMGAVLEGCANKIPSVGFSLLHHSLKADFSLSMSFVDSIFANVLEKGLPEGICLNVNIPAKVVPKGVRACRAAKGHWSEEYARYLDPMGNPFFILTGKYISDEPESAETDLYWLDREYISVVPATHDQTATSWLKDATKRFDQ